MLRRLFIVLLAFWLPLQAGAALAASLTLGMAPHPAGERAPAAAGHDHHASAGHDTHAGGKDIGQHQSHGQDAGCERCGLCQYVHGGVMLNAGAGLPFIPSPAVFSLPADERFTIHFPEPPQRPPLSAA